MAAEETLQQYLERRNQVLKEIIPCTDKLGQGLLQLKAKILEQDGVSTKTRVLEKIEGLGRPYTVSRIETTLGDTKIVEDYYVLGGEHRRHALWFNDPIAEITVITKNPDGKQSKIRMKKIGNGEAEFYFTPDATNFIEIFSWQIEDPDKIKSLLSDPKVVETLKTFGLEPFYKDEETGLREDPWQILFNQARSKSITTNPNLPHEIKELFLRDKEPTQDALRQAFETLSGNQQQRVLQAVYDDPKNLGPLGIMIAEAGVPQDKRKLSPGSRPTPGNPGIQEPTNWGETIVAVHRLSQEGQEEILLGMIRRNYFSSKNYLRVFLPNGDKEDIDLENISQDYKII
jgi:hypothetical protein